MLSPPVVEAHQRTRVAVFLLERSQRYMLSTVPPVSSGDSPLKALAARDKPGPLSRESRFWAWLWTHSLPLPRLLSILPNGHQPRVCGDDGSVVPEPLVDPGEMGGGRTQSAASGAVAARGEYALQP